MVKEGYGYGLPLLLVSGGLIWFRLYGLSACFFLLTLFVLNFFRDPHRIIPTDPAAIVSPADGKVMEAREEVFQNRAMLRVSIFMSPLDVHVNRSPIAGVIREVSYRRGSFHMASQARASLENEQNVFTMAGDPGEVVVKQIAGVLARRIVFWKKKGDRLERGERVGLIKFGSRADVLMNPKVELKVRVGDHVKAGSTVLGVMPSGESAG